MFFYGALWNWKSVFSTLCNFRFLFFFLPGWNTNSSLERTKAVSKMFIELHQVSQSYVYVVFLDEGLSSFFFLYKPKNVLGLLHFRHKPSEVELLFQLLRVFTIRHVPDFHFLRKFLDETVAKVSKGLLPLPFGRNERL